jgi:hypothetical protein
MASMDGSLSGSCVGMTVRKAGRGWLIKINKESNYRAKLPKRADFFQGLFSGE